MIKNPFRLYRHEVIGAYVDFFYAPYEYPVRPDMNEDGYDDLTEIQKFEDLSSEIKNHYLPFTGQISADNFFEYLDKSSFNDLKAVLNGDIPDESKLLEELGNVYLGPQKITEADFLYAISQLPDKRKISIDDIESFDIEFLFLHRKIVNDIKVVIGNLKLKEDRIYSIWTRSSPVPNAVGEYYFPSCNVEDILAQEYTLSPIMVFDVDLYLKIKDKIKKIDYSASKALV